MILGNTGSGKTTLLGWLLAEKLQGFHLALDPHSSPGKWGAIKVIGAGRSYREIARAIEAIYTLMDCRFKQMHQGIERFPIINVCLDEYPAISKSEECSEVCRTLIPVILREARKVGIRLIVLAQGGEVKTLGCEGEGSIRDQFCFVRLGKFAKQFARLDRELHEWFRAQSGNWAFVEDDPALVPNLAGYRPQFRAQDAPDDLGKLLGGAASLSPSLSPPKEMSDPLPKDFPPEAYAATAERLESLLDKGGSDFTSPTPEVPEATLTAIKLALEFGKSQTWIIENILKLKGRRFNEGKKLLIEILKQIEDQA